MSAPHFYLIAGEHSGDMLGSGLMRSLTHKLDGKVSFSGIGGEKMQDAGLKSLFPMQELSFMGFAEILPHIFHLKKRIRETAADIIQKKPDMLITIDSPGFTFRVVKQVRKALGKSIPIVHYVAPTVWAYKPERAAKTAALFDHLMVLLPFEPPYFEKEGLPTTFVGHPVLELWKEKGDAEGFIDTLKMRAKGPVLVILPGSRMGEIRQHMPVITQTLERLQTYIPNLRCVFIVNRQVRGVVTDFCNKSSFKHGAIIDTAFKKDAFAAATAALAKSGTVTLEVSAAGIAQVIIYKVNAITAWLVRRWIKISSANLLNYMSATPFIPERIQEDCTPDSICDVLLPLLADANARNAQVAKAAALLDTMRLPDGTSPNDKAAMTVLELLKK